MSQRGEEEREELLMRILDEESFLESDELNERLAADPELRVLVDEVMKLRSALDAAAETAREDLEASRPVDDAAAQRVRARVHDLAREALVSDRAAGRAADGKRSSGKPFGLAKWTILAAATLALLIALQARFSNDPPMDPMDPDRSARSDRDRVTLGSSLADLAPSGEVGRFDTFRWSFDDIGAGRFEVQVFRFDTGELVTMERGLKEARWQPSAERTGAWPSKIRWTVTAYDASGAMLDSAQASAERSPR